VDVPPEQDVVQNTHPVEQGKVLERSGNPELGHLVRNHARDVAPGQPYSPHIWRVKPGDSVGQCCLATPIRTDKPKDFSPLNSEIHTRDSDDATKPAFDPAALEYRPIIGSS